MNWGASVAGGRPLAISSGLRPKKSDFQLAMSAQIRCFRSLSISQVSLSFLARIALDNSEQRLIRGLYKGLFGNQYQRGNV